MTDTPPIQNSGDLSAISTSLERAITESGEPMLRYFRFTHLGASLQVVSATFAWTATVMVDQVTKSAERTVALRKLLEGKDAAVRAALEVSGSAT